jgi:hypothetical protein
MVILLEERGFLEDNTFINMKIVMGLGCTIIALLSQFWKTHEEEKLLDHKPWQGFCVVVYCIFMAGYYYIDYFLAKDSFFMCNGHEVSMVNIQKHLIKTLTLCYLYSHICILSLYNIDKEPETHSLYKIQLCDGGL